MKNFIENKIFKYYSLIFFICWLTLFLPGLYYNTHANYDNFFDLYITKFSQAFFLSIILLPITFSRYLLIPAAIILYIMGLMNIVNADLMLSAVDMHTFATLNQTGFQEATGFLTIISLFLYLKILLWSIFLLFSIFIFLNINKLKIDTFFSAIYKKYLILISCLTIIWGG